MLRSSLLAFTALAGSALVQSVSAQLNYDQLNAIIEDFSVVLPGPVQVSDPGETPVIMIDSDIVCSGLQLEALTVGTSFPDLSTLVAALHAENVSLKCRIDQATISEVFIIGTIVTAINIDISAADIDTSLRLASPDFSTVAPEGFALGPCDVFVENLELDFESNLGFILDLVKGSTEEEVKVTFKEEICGLIPTLFTGLMEPAKILGKAINEGLSDTEPIDYLESENAVVADGRNLFSLKEDPTVSAAIESIGEALRAVDEDGNLKANEIIQTVLNLLANFVGGDVTEPVEGQLLVDFTEEPLELVNLALTETNLTLAIPQVKITGLTSLEKLDLNLLGDYTALFEFAQAGELAIEIQGLLKTVNNQDLTVIVEDDFTISASLSDLAGAIGTSTIVDQDIVSTTQLGSLAETLFRCILNAFYSDPELIPTLGFSNFVAPTFTGLDSTGLEDILSNLIGAILTAYEATLIPALPKALPIIADYALNATFAPLRPYECEDYVEDPEDPFFDASTNELYISLQQFVEETLIPFLDAENVNAITEGQSGTAGTLALPEGVEIPEFTLPDLEIFGEYAGQVVSLDLKNLALSGLNTVANQDIKLLALAQGEDYVFLSQAAIASLGFTGDIKYTVAGEPTDFSVEAAINDFSTLLDFIAQVKVNAVLSKELGQISSTDCVIALAGSGSVGVRDFILGFTPSGSITCRECSAELTEIANNPQAFIDDINAWKEELVQNVTYYTVEAVAELVEESSAVCNALSSRQQPITAPAGSSILVPAIAGGVGGALVFVAAGVAIHKRRTGTTSEEVDVFAAHRVTGDESVEELGEKL